MARSTQRRFGSGGRGTWDESDVRVRPGKGSRPRTKDRPRHEDAIFGMVVSKDRGRWGVALPDSDTVVTCMRAREMGRTTIVVGDSVGIVGDTSGRKDTLARIVKLGPRSSILRRTADDTDPYERIVVANAHYLLIVTAIADPPPRTGFIARALIAAFAGGLTPLICLTKSDLADPTEFAAELEDLNVTVLYTGVDDDLTELTHIIGDDISAVIGHSGVGKSTMVNRLVPGAERATSEVSGVGKGRHTSTQSVALGMPDGAGWIIDTPGIRSFGLAHITPDQVISAFDDLRDVIEDCPRGCTHLGPPADPECALDELAGATGRRVTAVRQLLSALHSNNDWEM